MMSFKTFLEAEIKPIDPGEDIDRRELLAFLRENCSNAWNSFNSGGQILYRGFTHRVKTEVKDPSTGIRSSENTTNWYTSFLDTNAANSAWPLRSRAFICSTSETRAETFADGEPDQTAIVFPFDGVKIAEILTDDLWEVHPSNPLDMDKSIQFFNRLWPNVLNMRKPVNFDEAKTLIMTGLSDEEIVEAMTAFIGEWAPKQVENISEKTPEQIRQLLVDLLNEVYTYESQPKWFKLHGSMESITNGERECWFSGKCVLVPVDHQF